MRDDGFEAHSARGRRPRRSPVAARAEKAAPAPAQKPLDIAQAVEDVQLGASLRSVAIAFRQSLIDTFQFRPEEVGEGTFAVETTSFMKKFARHLGDRHRGDPQVLHALRDWVMRVEHYEAWDALLAGFDFHGKAALVRRGRVLFPGPMTAHWEAGDE